MKLPPREHLAGHMIVWIAHVSAAEDSLIFLEPCLDTRDRERAARFKFSADRARFVVGRGLLRQCLGHYLQKRPETIELAYTDLGRPILSHDDKIQFNISHTQDLVAIAVTAGARIGIDLECIHPDLDLVELAERIFSEEDLQVFQALPHHERLGAFYRAWTRKEAYLKARGEGIAESLQQISVSLSQEEIVPIEDSREPSSPNSWRLLTLPLPAGYAGALACDDLGKGLEGTFVHFDNGDVIANEASSFG
jgi:4'-phosphopantetheinyl transferase